MNEISITAVSVALLAAGVPVEIAQTLAERVKEASDAFLSMPVCRGPRRRPAGLDVDLMRAAGYVDYPAAGGAMWVIPPGQADEQRLRVFMSRRQPPVVSLREVTMQIFGHDAKLMSRWTADRLREMGHVIRRGQVLTQCGVGRSNAAWTDETKRRAARWSALPDAANGFTTSAFCEYVFDVSGRSVHDLAHEYLTEVYERRVVRGRHLWLPMRRPEPPPADMPAFDAWCVDKSREGFRTTDAAIAAYGASTPARMRWVTERLTVIGLVRRQKVGVGVRWMRPRPMNPNKLPRAELDAYIKKAMESRMINLTPSRESILGSTDAA